MFNYPAVRVGTPSAFHGCSPQLQSDAIDSQTFVLERQPSPIPVILNRLIPVEIVILSRKDGRIMTPHDDGDGGTTSCGSVMSPRVHSYNDSGFESDVSVGSPLQFTSNTLITLKPNATPQMESPFPRRSPICQKLPPIIASPFPKRSSILEKPPPMTPLMTLSSKPILKRKRETCQTTPPAMHRPCKKRRTVDQPQRITPLQRDLDAIFMSIRRVFFVNCFAFSNQGIVAERDRIVLEMKATSHFYSHNNLVEKDIRQDFSNWQVRWGYVFNYFLRHSHLVFYSLQHYRLCPKIALSSSAGWNIPFDGGKLYSDFFLQKCARPGGVLRVCAIGGGPGSDLIGLALFLRANRFPVKISVSVLDICGYWQNSWCSLIDELPTYLAQYFFAVHYVPFDYLQPDLFPDQCHVIANADLITVVKSLSPVASQLSAVRPVRLVRRTSIYNILSTVSTGTVVLYVDNKFGMQCKVMQEAIKSAKGYRLLHYQVTKVELPSTGFSDTSNNFMKWVGYGPSFFSGRNEVVVLARN